MKRRMAIVGAGHRSYSGYAEPLTKEYSDKIEICGVCDPNVGRCEYFRNTLNPDMKIYSDFDLMLEELKPDAVLVTSPDCYHHMYIIKALKFGCDVYSEKPITIDEEKCRAIREAEKASGKKVTVTFNCRFMPYFVSLKEIIASGKIGKPLTINYEYVLNTRHGGDYFKRWHRFIDVSGGMMLHKATHHFDIMNWLLADDPVRVSAQGARLFYGNDSRPHGERCSTCKYTEGCPSYQDFSEDKFQMDMYFANEKYDGYVRDHCSFASDTDIYDSMSVSVSYSKGTLLTYSLNLYGTKEGFTVNVVGELGRLEFSTLLPKKVIYYRDGSVEEIVHESASGGHAGGDKRMLKMLFGGETHDPLGQCADSYDGFKSVMIGAAANKSIKQGGAPVEIDKVLADLK